MRRALFGLPGVLALGMGLAAGLARLGVGPGTALAALHGPLMVGGFLGTVIGLERAVALGKSWGYLAPGFCGLGVLGLLVGMPAGPLLVLGSAMLVLVFGALLLRDPTLPTGLMALGALALTVGQGVWWTGTLGATAWWIVGLVGTIAGERLELTRMVRRPMGVQLSLVGLLGLLGVGVAYPTARGMALLGIAGWLGIFDVVRRTVRQEGLPRYVAIALLGGYVWLGIGGAILLWTGDAAAGPIFDAQLHAIFVGFVLSMIFGHAPVVLPAVLGGAPKFHPVLYLPLALLHLSLGLRIIGDIEGSFVIRLLGSEISVATILFFGGAMVGVLAHPEPDSGVERAASSRRRGN